MRNRLIPFFILAFASPLAVADISPGMWEITMETRVPAEPGFAPAPFRLNQCFTAEDARDPSRLLSGVSNPGASGCTYTDKNYSRNTFTFSMQCAGNYAIKSSGSVTYGADTMNGSIASTATVGGKAVETQNKLSARRVGSC